MTQVLYTRHQIQTRVTELGAQISRDYAGRELLVLVILKGSFVFAADLIRAISLELRVEFMGLMSYGAATQSTGQVQITQDLTTSIADRDLLIVEDIVDTGLTLDYLLQQLRTRQPRSVRLCALLHKPARTRVQVPIDYLGFVIDDVFVVGYGMDHGERYRHLPELVVLEP